MSKEWKKVGSIRKSKDGKLYMKVDMDVTLKTGESLQIRDPRKSLDEAVSAGRLSAEKAEEYKSKIPEFIRHEIIKPPNK